MTHRLSRFVIDAMEDPAAHFMLLPLTSLESDEVRGIYGKKKNHLPTRMRYLEPEARVAFRPIADLAVSDMLRSPESSLNARAKGRGAQRPGYSGHNYGLSIDIDVSFAMKLMGFSKRKLDEWMAERGWYCHRRDHRRKFEEWHYNYFGLDVDKYVKKNDRRTSAGIERKIVDRYGNWWSMMDNRDAQRCLQRLAMYDGDLDGDIGPLSKSAIQVFQRAWLLPKTTKLDKMTKRTLAFVTHDRVLTEL